jgi:general secretion pathway protein K
MVLIAVLWVVAALSILVIGLTRSVREEARMMSVARQGVEAAAWGEAAIYLSLREMVDKGQAVSRLTEVSVPYRGMSIQVQILPLNGLIDLNGASVSLLTSLYSVAGGVPRDVAESLAQATIQTRTRLDARGRPEQFAATEDLLRVPGVEYGLYARLLSLITADLGAGRNVNPMAATPDVLVVLANGNQDLAGRIAMEREAGQVGIDTTGLDASNLDSGTVNRYRLLARVPLLDGRWLRVTFTVALDAGGSNGLPWRIFHIQRGFESMPRRIS